MYKYSFVCFRGIYFLRPYHLAGPFISSDDSVFFLLLLFVFSLLLFKTVNDPLLLNYLAMNGPFSRGRSHMVIQQFHAAVYVKVINNDN